MNRNVVVDLMRFLGIALIILAHVEPPNIIFQARTFDVPMMVFVSGMAYYCSGKSQVNLVHYAISRFKRLVLPVWIFFIFFFSIIFIFKITQFQNLLTFKSIVSTFMLSGFSYVWIIKIFFISGSLISVISVYSKPCQWLPINNPIFDRVVSFSHYLED
ncbi:hypothetical protein O8Q81_000289 [Klebsiella oxytoca]|nr:hypothetical protein [Klebsiella oxytoca]EKJ7586992.1 hypothetical protein [Klebsiella oxytoca]